MTKPCDCDLRDRQWNPLSGKCENCGGSFVPFKKFEAAVENPVEFKRVGSCIERALVDEGSLYLVQTNDGAYHLVFASNR